MTDLPISIERQKIVNLIKPDLNFILEALPIESSIIDPKLCSEIDLVRRKVNEIIRKIDAYAINV